ncbi:unnamed protein product [Mycena citricolor]|uniref:O-fucosyltransferase family protein n=1 Tax=Mycena citricolor TaxID=2018698 RepID=A0AAD2K5Z2_9AGAR|nr:unnamed protein product [Mycena citricolor]
MISTLSLRGRILSVVLALLFFSTLFQLWPSRYFQNGHEVGLDSGAQVDSAVPQHDSQRTGDVPGSQNSGGHGHDGSDNLLNETRYISSWGASAGWTNDVITFSNLVYLGILTDRVPILPEFLSTHIRGIITIPFSEVFDLPRFRKLLGRPVLEWREVKDAESETIDELGCWNVWATMNFKQQETHDPAPRETWISDLLNLDISYTKTPPWISLKPYIPTEPWSSFWSLAALSFPDKRKASLVPPEPSPIKHVSLPPDEHLLCYDFVYYAVALEGLEFQFDFSPAWRFVGRYMRWTPRLEKLAEEYTRIALGGVDLIPPYISIHARRDDFKAYCSGGKISQGLCLPTLDGYAAQVEEVQAELAERGIHVRHVIITSDEDDPEWWKLVSARGWHYIDHVGLKTRERLGVWYPILIDSVVLSAGIGHVGTEGSTMSWIAAKRVRDWHGGVTRLLDWSNSE